MRLFHAFGFLFVLTIAVTCEAGLKIYYLRHGETGGNVQKEWADKPKSEWPDYVGRTDRFSPKGEQQVAAVPAKLAAYRFDFIAVSPLWRARQTILPYLKNQNRKAEIWPELTEFGHKSADAKLIGTSGLPPPIIDIVSATQGKLIVLSDDERPWFILREDRQHEPRLKREGFEGAADVTAMLEAIVVQVKERFGGQEGDISVLLVGHGNAGAALLRLLLKDAPRDAFRPTYHPTNTGLWMAEEQPDGTFRAMLFNDKPTQGTAKKDPVTISPQ